MRNFIIFDDFNKRNRSDYFDQDDLYDVISFNKIVTKSGKEMINIVFGNKTGSYLLPYNEKAINILYKKMQAIDSITENADGETITIKYKSFTITADIKYKSFYEELKKEQLRRGNPGCEEIDKGHFQLFGEYGKKPEYFIGNLNEILYLEIVWENKRPIVVVHFQDKLGCFSYNELDFGVLVSKMKKIESIGNGKVCFKDGQVYSIKKTVRPCGEPIELTPLFEEQNSDGYYYMFVFGRKKTYMYNHDACCVNVEVKKDMGMFTPSPKQIPIIGEKRGYFYYDIISGERICRGVSKNNNRRALFFEYFMPAPCAKVAEVLKELTPDYVKAYKKAINNLKLSEIPGEKTYIKTYESIRYADAIYEARMQEARETEIDSKEEIPRLLRDLDSKGR